MILLKKALTKPITVGVLVLLLSCTPASHAWGKALDKKQKAAISAIINMLLLDGEAPTSKKIGFDEYSNQTFFINDDFALEFDGQSEAVELCFVINASSQINAGDVVLKFNNQSFNVTAGENCFTISSAQQQELNTLTLELNNGISGVRLSGIGLASASPNLFQLPSLTRSLWNEKAVRKTLKIFAFGGSPTDSQIRQWASMPAKLAIREMLNFSQHNLQLAPFARGEEYRDILNLPGTFESYLNFISSDASNLPTPTGDHRRYRGVGQYLMEQSFGGFTTARGLNPFRQRIGFWETNYHLAVNLDAQVERDQLVLYYDSIMQAHEQGLPYKDVMGTAAKSAAIAMQYGHRRNRWDVDEQRCYCNDDFAREIHQLFYGIFGSTDPNHEDGTIRETAKMLTGMEVRYVNDDEGFADVVTMRPENHHTQSLTILGQSISGANANQKIDALMPISMQHPESLQNLPIMIIETLADDKLTDSKKSLLRQSWASLGVNRKLLDYIHAYAISNLFHSPTQFKYLTSFERAFYKANKFNIENIESFYDYYWRGEVGFQTPRVYLDDNANQVFRPLHNVFGGQTSIEASDSAVAFEKNFNRSAPTLTWQFNGYFKVRCDTCNAGREWQKDWTKVIPQQANGYPADYVAKWLWNHVVGSLDKYSTLERAHLLSILATDGIRDTETWDRFQFFDLNNLLCVRADRIANGKTQNNLSDLLDSNEWNDYCRKGSAYSTVEVNAFNQVLTGQNIENTSHIIALVNELGSKQIELNSDNDLIKRRANERIHAALAFIFSTPFVFAEGE